MSVTFRDKTEFLMYAREHLFNGNEQVLSEILQSAREILEKTIPQMDKQYAQDYTTIHVGNIPVEADPARADERKASLMRIMENKVIGQVIDNKNELSRQFSATVDVSSVRDAYERDAWRPSYDENALQEKAAHMLKIHMYDILEKTAKQVCKDNPPALITKEPSLNMPKPFLQDIGDDVKSHINEAVISTKVKSLLDTRKDGEPYKVTKDEGILLAADSWLLETNEQKLYEAVLFSNGKINDGAGYQALANIAKNGHTPEDALFMIARGELDNQGKAMMTNDDVSLLWLDVLANPKCPPELAMEITMNAACAKNIAPEIREGVIKEASACLDRADVEEFDRKFPEMDGILGAFDKLDEKEITYAQLAEQMSEILVEHGYLNKNFSKPETSFPEKESPQMDSREDELTFPSDVIS